MRDQKQHLTPDEFKQLKERLALVTTHLPKDDYTLRLVWSSYVKVIGIPQPQPCTCSSAGGLWLNAVETLRKYINENAEPQL
jgi:hypothetical protein